MKVADIMQQHVDYVTPDTTLLEVSRLIFGRGINGVPVCKEKKVIGFITERDILEQFYPSMQEYMEDPLHAGDFEAMEKNIDEILNLSASEIMSKNPTTIVSNTPVLRAQSTMVVHKIGRLPVVDGKGNLVGMISKGDIFRAVVGDKLPFEQDEQFHDWLSRRYNLIVDWETRFVREIPDLSRLFKKQNVTKIIDVGCGTGMHSMELAKNGFDVVGIDRSTRMIYEANEKVKELTNATKQKVRFIHHEYEKLQDILNETYDAAIFMGSGLAHNADPQQVLQEVNKVLNKKALIICQLTNFDKVLKIQKRFFSFSIRKSALPVETEQAFLRFYDPPQEGFLTLNVSVFARGRKKWIFRGMNATPISYLDKKKMASLLKKLGFSKISFYGGEKGFYYDYLFRKPFKPLQSDVLVVVAKR